MPIHLHIIYHQFHTTVTKLNGCDKDLKAHKPKIFTIQPFIEKFTNPCIS